MAEPSWNPIAKGVKVEAKPTGLWTKVCDYVGGKKLLKIEALPTQQWNYDSAAACGPDGDYATALSVQGPILVDAPVGALIGKVGGSTTGKDDVSVKLFPVGSFCVMRLADAQEGALFLTINNSPKSFGGHGGSIQVNVYEAL